MSNTHINTHTRAQAGTTTSCSNMAAWRRCVTNLAHSFVLLALITGSHGQCSFNTVQPLQAGMFVGSIHSPGYPDKYPDSAKCRWLLYADPGYVVHVHVAWIDIEESVGCTYDSITFYDGQTVNHNVLGRICNEMVKDFYSTSHRMYVEFISDFSVNADGFELEYSAIRPWEVPTPWTTPYPWPFPGTTTTMTTTTTILAPSGSGGSGQYSWPSYSMAALIGGMAGGLVLLFVLFALARYYMARHYHSSDGGGRQRQRQTAQPYPPPSAPPGTIYNHHLHNNNAVFMVSATQHPFHQASSPAVITVPSAPYDNLAFSPYGEAPPAYFSVQENTTTTTVLQPAGGVGVAVMGGGCYGGILPPPPSYTEAMRLSHPPAHSLHSPAPPAPPVMAENQANPGRERMSSSAGGDVSQALSALDSSATP